LILQAKYILKEISKQGETKKKKEQRNAWNSILNIILFLDYLSLLSHLAFLFRVVSRGDHRSLLSLKKMTE